MRGAIRVREGIKVRGGIKVREGTVCGRVWEWRYMRMC